MLGWASVVHPNLDYAQVKRSKLILTVPTVFKLLLTVSVSRKKLGSSSRNFS
jgi:hypothetical protein